MILPVQCESVEQHMEVLKSRVSELQAENRKLRAMAESPYMTRLEAAAYLRVSHDMIDLALARGQLPKRRCGRRVLIPRSAVQQWVEL